METPTWIKQEMVCDCGCGRKFKPQYRNGILISRLCPNCRLQALHKPKGVILASQLDKPAKSKKTKQKSGIDKSLDAAWSKLVKLKAGNKCAVCGNQRTLNSHHIYSRAKMSLRWSTINGICLCVGHHIGVNFSAHKTPTEFTQWLIENLGVEFMDGLKITAHSQSNLHAFEKEILLKELHKEIIKLKHDG
jgi:predicted restriction endonuclease